MLQASICRVVPTLSHVQDDSGDVGASECAILAAEVEPTSPCDLVAADEIEDEASALACGARALRKTFWQKAGKQSELPTAVSRQNTMRRVQAAAECVSQAQVSAFSRVAELSRRLSAAGAWQPVAFVEHILYDETTMDVRASFEVGRQSQGIADRQMARVFAIETHWSLLVKTNVAPGEAKGAEVYTVLKGSMSPAIRASANATGETISDVLHSAELPWRELSGDPPLAPLLVRVAETDDCAANFRAEAFIMEERKQESSAWTRLGLSCLAHK
eukprot:6466419-Amphidinium_carterae.1